MRRSNLAGALGFVVLLTSATPAAAQGWGLGIFAKWSGPGPFRGYNVRATLGCWANTNVQLKNPERFQNVYSAEAPFHLRQGKWDKRDLSFLLTGTARATFTPTVRPPDATTRSAENVPDSTPRAVTQAAQAYLCLEYEHSSLYNDDVDSKGAISLMRDGVLMMFVPPIGSPSRWLGQFLEIGGGGGVRWYRSEVMNQRDPYVSAQVLVKPFGWIKNSRPDPSSPAGELPNSFALLKGFRIVYASDWFPTVTNDDFHLPNGFEHTWQHGLTVAFDFTSFLFDR